MKLISRRVIFAAAKLALIYCVLLSIEIAALFLLIRPSTVFIGDIAGAALALLIPFGIAFLLLAVARRAGFVALWAILVGYWVALVIQSRPFVPLTFPMLFLLWSILALPLWIIGHAGIPDTSSAGIRIGGLRISWSTTALVCWLLLLVVARLFGPLRGTTFVLPRTPRPADIAMWALWAPAPLFIAAFAVRHVWRGTAAGPLSSS